MTQPSPKTRYVTRPGGDDAVPEIPRSKRGTDAELDAELDSITVWDQISGRHDPDQAFRLYRLCECETCAATGRVDGERCPDCRGEGRGLDLVAACGTSEATGATLVRLALEGEFEECPFGLLWLGAPEGKRWLVKPWPASPRTISDAGRVLRSAQGKGKA